MSYEGPSPRIGPTLAEKIVEKTIGGAATGAILGFILNRIFTWVLAKDNLACAPYPACDSLQPIGYSFEGVLLGAGATLAICITGFVLIQRQTWSVGAAAAMAITLLVVVFCHIPLDVLWIPVTVLAGSFALIALISVLTFELGPIWRRTKS